MSTNSTKLSDLFPCKEFTPLSKDQKPTCAQINRLQKQADANARSIESSRGSGRHGLLAVVVTACKCRQMTGVDSQAPRKPRSLSLAADASAAHIALEFRAHDKKVAEWSVCNNTIKELRSMLLVAAPREYIAILADDDNDFSDVMP